MSKKLIIVAVAITAIAGSSLAATEMLNPRYGEIQEYRPNHTHVGDLTIDAPQHSGGTDAYNCHNASVPYHCH